MYWFVVEVSCLCELLYLYYGMCELFVVIGRDLEPFLGG